MVKYPLEIIIVLAGTHPFKEVKNYLKKLTHKFEVHENLEAEQMAKTMEKCDIACTD